MVNFAGPYEVEIKYTVDSLKHVHRLNTSIAVTPAVGEDVANIDLLTKVAGSVNLDTAVNAYVNLIKANYHTSVTFDSYDLYQYQANNVPRKWLATALLGIAGTAAGSPVPAESTIWTFRTQNGGSMRLVHLETSFDSNLRESYASLGPSSQAFMDSVVADTNWILARDDSYPIVQLNRVLGQNERVFRKRYR